MKTSTNKNKSEKTGRFIKSTSEESKQNSTYKEPVIEIPEFADTPFPSLKLARKDKYSNWNIVHGNEVCSSKTFKTTKKAIKYIKKNPIEISIVASLIAINWFNKNHKHEAKN